MRFGTSERGGGIDDFNPELGTGIGRRSVSSLNKILGPPSR